MRDDWPEGDDGVLERADPDCVFPAELARMGLADDIVPADTVDELDFVEVKMDGMRIHPIVGDPPDLRAVTCRRDRGYE